MLEGFLVTAFAAVAITLGGGALWSYARAQRERANLWMGVARSADFADVRLVNSFPLGQSVVGRSDGLRVRIESRNRDRDHRDTRVIVFDDLEQGTSGVTLRPERSTSAEFAKLFGSSEIEIGDAAFDEAFFIGGTPARVYAFLDLETRGTLLRMNEQGALEIGPAGIRLDIPEEDESRLLGRVPGLLVDLARRLRERGDTPERLARNVRDDPQPGIRLGSLLCLIREFAKHPVVAEALHAACEDRSPEVRLRAATALGARGTETLLQMTEDLGLADVWQAAAVSALGMRLPIASAVKGLERALRAHRFETARACIEVLGRGDDAAVEPLAKALTVATGVVASASAKALGMLRTAAAEEPLIRALSREAPGLRVAAAEALGRSGSSAAVLPLKQAADRYSQTEFRRAARQAIGEIQGRIPGASPGQLSLSAAETGQLSLAAADTGQLSIAESQGGQLSLPQGRKRGESSGGG